MNKNKQFSVWHTAYRATIEASKNLGVSKGSAKAAAEEAAKLAVEMEERREALLAQQFG